MKLLPKLLLALTLTILPLGTVQASPIVVNGGFEAPDVASGGWAVFFPGIPGWTVTTGSGIEIQDHVFGWLPFEGNQHVELDSFGNSGMLQTIATTPGQDYRLSFAYSPRPGVSAASNPIEVYFNATLLDTIALSGSGLNNTSWTVFNYNVTAPGTSASLEFRAAGTSDSLGGLLDGVQLTAVPEPGTLLMAALGAVGLAGRRYFRRAQ